MNTLEQIVSQHPCPIIRAKIMENVNVPNYEKSSALSEITNLILHGINNWGDTKEGVEFWDAVYMDNADNYNDLKHLDKSYTPEPAPPTPKWLPIDRDNLYPDKVVAMDICGSENGIYFGTLELDRNNDIVLYLGNGQYLPRFTHYIPLVDLLNLPISE